MNSSPGGVGPAAIDLSCACGTVHVWAESLWFIIHIFPDLAEPRRCKRCGEEIAVRYIGASPDDPEERRSLYAVS